MMYGYHGGWAWMWVGGILLLLILAALIVLIVLVVGAFSSKAQARAGLVPKAPTSSARQIIEERLARGEITPDEFRQLARILDEHSP